MIHVLKSLTYIISKHYEVIKFNMLLIDYFQNSENYNRSLTHGSTIFQGCHFTGKKSSNSFFSITTYQNILYQITYNAFKVFF